MVQQLENVEKLFKRETRGFEGNAVDLKNHTIYYEAGSNSQVVERTFILAHGAGGSGRFMNPLAQELITTIPNSKIIILDLPFHGYSIPGESNTGFNVHNYTEVMNELLEEMKSNGLIEGIPHWIGWSLGGSIGILSNLTGGGVEELTLLNSSPVWYTIDGLLQAIPAMSDEVEVIEAFKAICEGQVSTKTEPELAKAFLENYYDITPIGKVMVQDFAGVAPKHYDVVDELTKVTAKTLIISGTEDPVAEVKYQEIMKQDIPNAELLLLEDDHCMLVKPYAVKVIVKAISDRFIK